MLYALRFQLKKGFMLYALSFKLKMALFIFSIIVFTACQKKERSRESVELAMQKYDSFILNMNVDSISMLYAPDGELGKIAKGRDSIRKLLENFKKYKVLSQVSVTDSISVYMDTAVQSGLYTQKVIVPVNDTVTVKGRFTARWIWMDLTGWHIQHMETQPVK